MRVRDLISLVTAELFRSRGALATSGFGIAAGTAALVFFLALGLGVRTVLLGKVFPIDQVELEPPKGEDPGLLGLVLGKGQGRGIPQASVDELRKQRGVQQVYPKLRFAFPASARGGADVLGRDVGTSELVGDGIDPDLVSADLPKGVLFADPLVTATKPCSSGDDCSDSQYCEIAPKADKGLCSEPIPALISVYLLELFDKSIAKAHGFPPIAQTLADRAESVVFTMRIGESLLGKAKNAEPRVVKARIVGVSSRAIDLGITLPIEVVRRYNREFAGASAADEFSSVIVRVDEGTDAARVIDHASKLGLEPRDTRARDVSLLTLFVMALLSLVSLIILIISASNIAHTFRVFVSTRRGEIGLYRALGARARDIGAWVLSLSAAVGIFGGIIGVTTARLGALLVDRLARDHVPEFPFKPESFFAFPWWLLIAGGLFGAGFSLLGALAPSIRAMRMDPARALAERV